MTKDEKLGRISAFEACYGSVDELLEGIGRDELLFAPPVQDAWSINDFLVHFLDADISLAFRIRSAIAEPGRAVPVWEEEAWHDRLKYDEEDGLQCLGLAKGIRTYVSRGLRAVADVDWSMLAIEHPVRGRLGLDAIIEMYDQHVVFHLPLIKRNRLAWRKR
jgi:hypothetical protein